MREFIYKVNMELYWLIVHYGTLDTRARIHRLVLTIKLPGLLNFNVRFKRTRNEQVSFISQCYVKKGHPCRSIIYLISFTNFWRVLLHRSFKIYTNNFQVSILISTSVPGSGTKKKSIEIFFNFFTLCRGIFPKPNSSI